MHINIMYIGRPLTRCSPPRQCTALQQLWCKLLAAYRVGEVHRVTVLGYSEAKVRQRSGIAIKFTRLVYFDWQHRLEASSMLYMSVSRRVRSSRMLYRITSKLLGMRRCRYSMGSLCFLSTTSSKAFLETTFHTLQTSLQIINLLHLSMQRTFRLMKTLQ